jgi:hypothetical protein
MSVYPIQGQAVAQRNHQNSSDKQSLLGNSYNSETGLGNTRLDQEDSLKFGVDWIRLVARFKSWKVAEQFIEYCLNYHPYICRDEIPFGLGGGAPIYQSSFTSACGVRGGYREISHKEEAKHNELHRSNDGYLATDNKTRKEALSKIRVGGETHQVPKSAGKEFEVIIDMSGRFLQTLSLPDKWVLLAVCLDTYKARCSRIDTYIDDFSHQIIPINEMDQACRDMNNALFQWYTPHPGKGLDTSTGEWSLPTWYFGSRNSRKMVRVYWHWHEQWQCYSLRMETEFKRTAPQQVFNVIGSYQKRGDESEEELAENLSRILAGYTVGAIDFVDKKSRREAKGQKTNKGINYADCPRLEFWQRFIDRVGTEIKTAPVQTVTTLKDRIEWIRRQVAKTVKILKEGLGAIGFRNFVSNLIKDANERWRGEDEVMLQQLKQEMMMQYSL